MSAICNNVPETVKSLPVKEKVIPVTGKYVPVHSNNFFVMIINFPEILKSFPESFQNSGVSQWFPGHYAGSSRTFTRKILKHTGEFL